MLSQCRGEQSLKVTMQGDSMTMLCQGIDNKVFSMHFPGKHVHNRAKLLFEALSFAMY
jgi:hypothetical protein